jgi:hypothetical protein
MRYRIIVNDKLRDVGRSWGHKDKHEKPQDSQYLVSI